MSAIGQAVKGCEPAKAAAGVSAKLQRVDKALKGLQKELSAASRGASSGRKSKQIVELQKALDALKAEKRELQAQLGRQAGARRLGVRKERARGTARLAGLRSEVERRVPPEVLERAQEGSRETLARAHEANREMFATVAALNKQLEALRASNRECQESSREAQEVFARRLGEAAQGGETRFTETIVRLEAALGECQDECAKRLIKATVEFDEATDHLRAQLRRLEAQVAESQAELEKARDLLEKQHTAASGECQDLGNENAQLRRELERVIYDKDRLASELETIEMEAGRHENQLRERDEIIREKTARLLELEENAELDEHCRTDRDYLRSELAASKAVEVEFETAREEFERERQAFNRQQAEMGVLLAEAQAKYSKEKDRCTKYAANLVKEAERLSKILDAERSRRVLLEQQEDAVVDRRVAEGVFAERAKAEAAVQSAKDAVAYADDVKLYLKYLSLLKRAVKRGKPVCRHGQAEEGYFGRNCWTFYPFKKDRFWREETDKLVLVLAE